MKSKKSQLGFAAVLLGLTVVLYAIRYAWFSDPALHNEMWRFLIGDIGFLFLQVLLVTLVIDGMLQRRQREEMLVKLNMVIGAFFSEAGQGLLGIVAAGDSHLAEVRDDLIPRSSWTPADYSAARTAFRRHEPHIELTLCDLELLRTKLTEVRPFLIGLIGNQNLLEHETFTDLLWALTHLGEELAARPDLEAISKPDAVHLSGDVKRAYTLLGVEWISYLQHLQTQYPYLFSLAVRTNPLDPQAHAAVTE